MTGPRPWPTLFLVLLPIAQAWFALRSARSYRRLPVLSSTTLPPSELPPVSVAVPARNEAHNLPAQ
jgi:hypothetical protein